MSETNLTMVITVGYDKVSNKLFTRIETPEQKAKREELERKASLANLELQVHELERKLDNLSQFVRDQYVAQESYVAQATNPKG